MEESNKRSEVINNQCNLKHLLYATFVKKITDNEILKRMLLQNIREENVVGISERDSAEVIDKNKLGKFFQRPNKNDHDKVS